MEVSQMSDQTAALRKLPITKNAAKFSPNTALESNVTHEIPLGDVRSRATRTLPLAVSIPDFTAYRATMTIQSEYMRVTLSAARTHVRLVRFRNPSRRTLIEHPEIRRASHTLVKRSRVAREINRWQRLQVHLVVRFALWKKANFIR